MKHTDTALDAAACYRAVKSRDARFDGRFFTAVATTGVYCRPICPARTPLARNVTFFGHAAAAEAAGYRPCKRCRPETAPGTPAWRGSSATVARAMRLIDQGLLDTHGVEELAGRLGVGDRHLRRLFVQQVGAAPLAVAQTRRAHFARKLIDETRLPMAQVAHAAGFASVRRFNAAIRARFGQSPTALRRRGPGAPDDGGVSLSLALRQPYDWRLMLAALATRGDPGEVTGLEYRRSVDLAGHRGEVRVERAPGGGALVLRAPAALSPVLMELVLRARSLLDLDAAPQIIAAHLAQDPLLRRLVRRRPGLRVPGPWDLDASNPAALPARSRPLRRIMERLGEPATPARLRQRARAWRPWRAYAVAHLLTAHGGEKQ